MSFQKFIQKLFSFTPSTPSNRNRILMDKVQTALIRTLKDRDNPSDPSFRESYNLLYENLEDCVCVFLVSSNNYSYQMRTNNYRGGSSLWETLYIATPKGYASLGRRNIYDRNNLGGVPSANDLDKVEVQDGNIIIYWKEREPSTLTISNLEQYDFPLELPPNEQKVIYEIGDIIVIDDEEWVIDGLRDFRNRNRGDISCSCIDTMPYWSWYDRGSGKGNLSPYEKIQDMIRTDKFPYNGNDRLDVKLVLLDGAMFNGGRDCNTELLIPKLREIYPNAIIFANSGGHNGHSHNSELIRAGCDCALPEADTKTDLRKILEICHRKFPERNIKRRERLSLAEVVGFDPIR